MESTEAIRGATRTMQLKQGLDKKGENTAKLQLCIKQIVQEMKCMAKNLAAE